MQRRGSTYDKEGEAHYDVISAFIKSIRGSDPDAALYWLARMLDGGEDPLFIARRLVILASEDVGLADSRGLQVAIAAQQAVHFVGMPEGFFPLAHATLYLATGRRRATASDAPTAPRWPTSWNAQRSGAAAPAQRADRLDAAARLRPRLLYSHDDYDADAALLPENVARPHVLRTGRARGRSSASRGSTKKRRPE